MLQLCKQPSADAPAHSPASLTLREIERTSGIAFFSRIEKTTNLEQRASLLRYGGFSPYDEHTRGLVRSVAGVGIEGALVQHLLHTPEPMPASVLKPARLPRPCKTERMRPPKSLFEMLSDMVDETV